MERLRKMLSTCERLFGALQGRRQAFPLFNQSSVARLSLIQFLRLPLALIGADEVLHRSLKIGDNRFRFADLFFQFADTIFQLLAFYGVKSLLGGIWDGLRTAVIPIRRSCRYWS